MPPPLLPAVKEHSDVPEVSLVQRTSAHEYICQKRLRLYHLRIRKKKLIEDSFFKTIIDVQVQVHLFHSKHIILYEVQNYIQKYKKKNQDFQKRNRKKKNKQ